jgi:protein-S-isoprenylcysteine O-methyltransferase Ste14
VNIVSTLKKEIKKGSSFIIVILPNLLFFIVLGIILFLFFLFELPWILLPGNDVLYPWRLIELIAGTLLLIVGLYFFTWGLTTISRKRASGKEIGKSIDKSTLISDGAFAICRHPITLGFIFLMPGISFIFDFIPLMLMTPFYTPLLISLLFYEEKELIQRFGEGYRNYKGKVPLLIPRIKKSDSL